MLSADPHNHVGLSSSSQKPKNIFADTPYQDQTGKNQTNKKESSVPARTPDLPRSNIRPTSTVLDRPATLMALRIASTSVLPSETSKTSEEAV